MIKRGLSALCAILIVGGVAMAADLTRLPGVVALAESQHRDRWGVDGWHPWLATDGQDGTAWLSDNWEYSHTLAIVFPKQVSVQQVAVNWSGDRPPRSLVVRGWAENGWRELKRLEPDPAQPRCTVAVEATGLVALAITQPLGEAHPEADRRLGVREFQVLGELAQPEAAVDTAAVKSAIAGALARERQAEADRLAAPRLAVVMQKPKDSGFMGLINRADLARGRKNIATRAWAKQYRDGVVKDADWWVGKSDEYLYDLIPVGNPRAVCPSFEKGCPIHGGARGTYTATLEKPFRWKCSKGGEEWYDGAVVKNPKTGEDVTVRDDGSGWQAPEGFLNPGRRYYYVAAYRYFVLGKLFHSPYEGDGGSEYRGGTPITALAQAYAATGDAKYAHKAAVLLNRLAEVYRFYDGTVEGPSQRQDGYIGQTFERFLVQNLILCCDLIWDEVGKDTELQKLFAARGNADYNGDGKVDGGDFTYNLQRNLLGYIYEYLHRCMPYFDGDFIMYEMTGLAALTACLNNADLAEEMLNSDVGLRVMLTNEWFRDGKFIYDSTGYNLGNAQTPLQIAEWMHGFTIAADGGHDFSKPLDLYNDPATNMAMLFDFIRNVDCDGRVPQIGDTGGGRYATLNASPPYSTYDERGLLRLPSARDYYRRRLLAASSGDLETFRAGRADAWLVYHAEAPEVLKPGERAQAPVPRSHVFDDGGIAILRAGESALTRMHVPLTFSKGQYAHGHPDKLAINVFRYGWDLSADLGYPTTWTDIKTGGWETNTASHCTVMVDERGQQGYVIGNLSYFVTEPACDVVEATAEKAYPQCSQYRRTVALVRDDRGEPLYVADLFRVTGGQTRDYLFHSLGKPEDMEVTLDGAAPSWLKQTGGSLAGADVAPMSKGGYGFMWDVMRTRGEGLLRATWKPTTGMSQGDRYLLTQRSFQNCTVEFQMTRTGQAGGPQERAVFVFATDPQQLNSRRVIMLPVGELPVGKPVPVKIEVKGAQAQAFISGQPVSTVHVSGNPGTSGSVGFLHYYNYAFDYRDLKITPEGEPALSVDLTQALSPKFWSKIDPTYRAADGVLRTRDTEPLQLALTMLGAPGREVIRATAEGYGVRGTAPLEGHLVVRDRPADTGAQSTYLAAIEATNQPPRVSGMQAVDVQGVAAGLVSAFVVEIDGGKRRDLILSRRDGSLTPCRVEFAGQEITFTGRFALYTEQGGKAVRRMQAGGTEAPPVTGTVTAANVETSALAVKLAPGAPVSTDGLVGRRLIVRNPAYNCVSVYTIQRVERVEAGLYRFGLNMPLTIARGVVGRVDKEQGLFASQTPIMKLRFNAGLFDGRALRNGPNGKEWRLKTATEERFAPADPAALAQFPAGGTYLVCDVGAGDEVEVVCSISGK